MDIGERKSKKVFKESGIRRNGVDMTRRHSNTKEKASTRVKGDKDRKRNSLTCPKVS